MQRAVADRAIFYPGGTRHTRNAQNSRLPGSGGSWLERAEMLGAQALALRRNVRELVEVTTQLGRGPWCLRFYHQPTHLHAAPVPKIQLAAKMFPEFQRVFCDDSS